MGNQSSTQPPVNPVKRIINIIVVWSVINFFIGLFFLGPSTIPGLNMLAVPSKMAVTLFINTIFFMIIVYHGLILK